jgi:transcriptional regulator with XRE-family HTH domain
MVVARKQFAANLKAARLKAGLSQEALGDIVGLHRSEISLLERAERDPRLATIVKLADGLALSPAALLENVS